MFTLLEIWANTFIYRMKQREYIYEWKLLLHFIGEKINLFNIDSVAGFSADSYAIYLPSEGDRNAELTINLSLLDSPRGIYTLTVIPDVVSGTIDKYNLMVDTKFERHQTKNDINILSGKWNCGDKNYLLYS